MFFYWWMSLLYFVLFPGFHSNLLWDVLTWKQFITAPPFPPWTKTEHLNNPTWRLVPNCSYPAHPLHKPFNFCHYEFMTLCNSSFFTICGKILNCSIIIHFDFVYQMFNNFTEIRVLRTSTVYFQNQLKFCVFVFFMCLMCACKTACGNFSFIIRCHFWCW